MSAIIEAAFAYRAQVRGEFQDVLEAKYAAAERDCNAVLLNARGREGKVDPFSLFYGPYARVAAYASPELIEWFAVHGRMTFAQFERQYLEHGSLIDARGDTSWSAAS